MTAYQRKMVIIAIRQEIQALTNGGGYSPNSERVEALELAADEIASIGK